MPSPWVWFGSVGLFGCLLVFGFVLLGWLLPGGPCHTPDTARGRHSFFSLIETVPALPLRVLHTRFESHRLLWLAFWAVGWLGGCLVFGGWLVCFLVVCLAPY